MLSEHPDHWKPGVQRAESAGVSWGWGWASVLPFEHLCLPCGLTPCTVRSQPHFSSSPLLHALVTAKATPAEEMAYTKAASRVPVGGRGKKRLCPRAPQLYFLC